MKNKAYEIAVNPKCDGYQKGLASMVYAFFDKKVGLRASVNEKLAQEPLHQILYFLIPGISWKAQKYQLIINHFKWPP